MRICCGSNKYTTVRNNAKNNIFAKLFFGFRITVYTECCPKNIWSFKAIFS